MTNEEKAALEAEKEAKRALEEAEQAEREAKEAEAEAKAAEAAAPEPKPEPERKPEPEPEPDTEPEPETEAEPDTEPKPEPETEPSDEAPAPSDEAPVPSDEDPRSHATQAPNPRSHATQAPDPRSHATQAPNPRSHATQAPNPRSHATQAPNPRSHATQAPNPRSHATQAPDPRSHATQAPNPRSHATQAPNPRSHATQAPNPRSHATQAPNPRSHATQAPNPRSHATQAPNPRSHATQAPNPRSHATQAPNPRSHATQAPNPRSHATQAPDPRSHATQAPDPEIETAVTAGVEMELEAALEDHEDSDQLATRKKRRETKRTPVVIFDQVTKTYNPGKVDEYTAIRDVTFTVEDIPNKGEFVSILGPSGCGKSTVLRLIAGLEPQHPATSGDVLVFGQRIVGPGSDRGMVFQSYTSFDNRTVLDNITFGLECRGGMSRRERRELAKDWIDKVGLSVKHDADKYPHELSGGMQQRVAIARTLILKPKIILMDEPFGALDPLTRMHMQDTLVALWREVEATVFFVTHSIEESVYLGDRVYIFSNPPGRLLKEVDVPPPDRPAMEMQREPSFQEVVFDIRDLIDHLERQQDAEKRALEEAASM
jgi:NitT/TauT family transport system ATP-binding protein